MRNITSTAVPSTCLRHKSHKIAVYFAFIPGVDTTVLKEAVVVVTRQNHG